MFDTTPYEDKITAALSHFEDDLKKIRTGRAHPDMLQGIYVDAYGSRVPLNQVANITVPEPQLLQVNPFDQGNVKLIVEAIRNDQGLGFNPSDDGRLIRVPVPALTEDRRRDIVKQLGGKVEDVRINLRTIRQTALKDAKRQKEDKILSENDVTRIEKEVDKLMAEQNLRIDEISRIKEKEIMTV